jgi:L-asparaginase
MKPKIRVIATGGTISKGIDSMNESQCTLEVKDLIAMIPDISNYADIECEDFCRIPSPYLSIQEAFSLVVRVKDILNKDQKISGIVITHGTSSMEETAFLCWLLIDDPRPVVFTGAVIPPKYADTDGPRNILNAIKIAGFVKARKNGVLVCLNNEINSARYVRKTHSILTGTFKAGKHGILGYVTKDRIVFFNKPLNQINLKTEKIDPNIDLIKLALGSGIRQIKESIKANVSGIVIEAMGSGNMPPLILDAIIQARKRGIPVVVVSRCDEGLIEKRKLWNDNGIVSGGDLDGLKARILLCLLVTITKESKRIQKYFDLLIGQNARTTDNVL